MYTTYNFQVCEDAAGKFCSKNKDNCADDKVKEKCPVMCDQCPTPKPQTTTTPKSITDPTTPPATTTPFVSTLGKGNEIYLLLMDRIDY